MTFHHIFKNFFKTNIYHIFFLRQRRATFSRAPTTSDWNLDSTDNTSMRMGRLRSQTR